MAKQLSRKDRIKKGVCLHCPNKALTRGCCARCRQAANAHQIKHGLSDAQMVKQGLLLESKKRGPKPASIGFYRTVGAR